MRGLLFGGAAAMVLSASVPVPVAIAQPTVQDPSPVRCNTGQTDDYAGTAGYGNAAIAGVAAPPAPPPPPMMVAPAPVMAPAASSESDMVVVTGVRSKMTSSSRQTRTAGGITSSSIGYAAPASEPNTENYDGKAVSSVVRVTDQPVSTFSVDVDTGAYANVRRMLNAGETPPEAAVRTEEMLNYFRYDYPLPQDKTKPFSITTNVVQTPWNPQSRLLRVGLRAYDVPREVRPAANLVFLVDVSGSMDEPDKLPLVKSALSLLADNLRPDDTVSIVVYAGNAGMVLAPTHDGRYVKQALECLAAGGSTAGGEGIALAYDTARANFIKGGVNRVILATDGDFNVGVSDTKDLEALIKQNRDSGVTLTTLGFGEGNYNEAGMEHMADVGNGNYAYIDNALEARKVLDDELESTLVTVAKDVKIQVEFNPAQVSQYRLIGYEDRALREQDFNNDAVDAGDIGAGHQVTALYEIIPAGTEGWVPERHFDGNKPAATDAHGNEMVYVKLRYKLPNEDQSRLIEQAVPASALTAARAPSGDMAFATSVAAYGQLLRGDTNMGTFTMGNVRELAGEQSGYLRSEFVELTKLVDHSAARN